MNKRLEIKAYAKINLCLDVLGKCENGYHRVDMIMQSIELHDDITIILNSAKKTKNITLNVKDCRSTRKDYCIKEKNFIPTDSKNLMYRAAELMLEKYDTAADVNMTLVKRIPSQAGLGGGSADAAAVFIGLNEMLDIGASKNELSELSSVLGSDIPFCIEGGTARAEGTGTEITALQPLSLNAAFPQYVLLVKPFAGGSTPKIYAEYDSAEKLLSDKMTHPDTESFVQAINGSEKDKLRECLVKNNINVLEYAVRPQSAFSESAKTDGAADSDIACGSVCRSDIIGSIKALITESGAFTASMTGSGSVVYGLYDTLDGMLGASEKIKCKCKASGNICSVIPTRIR